MILTETEIYERISHCQEVALTFIQSRKPPIKRSQVKKSLKARLSIQIGKKCPTCDRIITKSSTSAKNYNPSASSFTVEHLFPFVLGGNNTHENLMVAMCYHCNARRNTVMTSFIGHVIGPKTQRTIPESGKIPQMAMNQVKRFVEWSISSVLLPEKDQDVEIQDIWLSLENFSSLEEKPDEMSILLNRMARLEERVGELENTMWRRALRFIKTRFSSKPKKKISSSLKSIEETSIETKGSLNETSEAPEIKFTPEEFSKGLLSQKKRLQPVTFTTLYARLIKEKPLFNLKQYQIKPNHYLTSKCSDFLLIIEKSDGNVPPLIHYWIDDKPEAQRNIVTDLVIDSEKLIQSARERATKEANKQIDAERDRIARTNTHAKEKITSNFEKFDLDHWIHENWQDESSYPLLKEAILAHEEDNKGKRSLKDILKEDFDIPKSWTIAKKSSYWDESKDSIDIELDKPPEWSELDTSNENDLLKLLISLIGKRSVNVAELGTKIVEYQKNNTFQDTGSKALLREFGLTGSLNQTIMNKFSEKISAQATSFRTHPKTRKKVPASFEYSVIRD